MDTNEKELNKNEMEAANGGVYIIDKAKEKTDKWIDENIVPAAANAGLELVKAGNEVAKAGKGLFAWVKSWFN